MLKAALRPAHSLAVVGIGSELRGDDIAGLLVLRHLRAAMGLIRRNKTNAEPSRRIVLFNGGAAPENLTGEIARFRPSHILLVDAADLGMEPGGAALIEPEALDGIPFSTHVMPLNVLAGYLKEVLSCRIIILGIQPGNCAFGSEYSPAIGRAARRLARLILEAVPLEGE